MIYVYVPGLPTKYEYHLIKGFDFIISKHGTKKEANDALQRQTKAGLKELHVKEILFYGQDQSQKWPHLPDVHDTDLSFLMSNLPDIDPLLIDVTKEIDFGNFKIKWWLDSFGVVVIQRDEVWDCRVRVEPSCGVMNAVYAQIVYGEKEFNSDMLILKLKKQNY